MNHRQHEENSTSEPRIGVFGVLSELFGSGGSGARSEGGGGGGTAFLRLAGLLGLTVAAFLVVAAPASAKVTHVFGESFGTPCTIGPCALGQLTKPSSVSVNETNGDVYVVDKGNSRVQVFNSAGTATAQFNGSSAPTGALEAPTWIAIDNDPTSESFEDVYVSGQITVAGETVNVIYKFEGGGTYIGQIKKGEAGEPLGEIYGLATDPEGKVWVFEKTSLGEGKIDDYTSAEPNVFTASRGMAGRGPNPGFAVDSEDNYYVKTGELRFAKFDSSGIELIPSLGAEGSTAVAVDQGNDSSYVDQLTTIGRFAGNGEPLDTFGSSHLTEGAGLAVDSGSPEKLVYVADSRAGQVRVFKEVTLPDVITGPATAVKAHSALLHGSVDPDEAGAATCRFAWGTTAALTGTPVPCDAGVPDGNTPQPVQAVLPGLAPNTSYFFRLEASNAQGTNPGEASQTLHFTTVGPATIDAAFATGVSADSATLGARVALHGVPTSYRFEYGETIGYGTSVPVPDGPLGSGSEEVSVAQAIQGLAPGTTYHFRVRTTAEVEPGVFEETIGPDRTFTTQPSTSVAGLLDGRQYQLVSPPDKGGGTIEPIKEFGITQATPSGAAITYLANAPTEGGAQGYAQTVQVLSSRGASGWNSQDIANPHASVTSSGLTPPEYSLFAEDLSAALFQPWGLFESSLSAEASEQTPYLRALTDCSGRCSTPLLTTANALPGFGEELECEEGHENGATRGKVVRCGPGLVGATADLRHAALISPAPLSLGAGREQLYEWSVGGSLKQVSLLPANNAGEELPVPDEAARLGSQFAYKPGPQELQMARRAISTDGSRVFWEDSESHVLYLRDTEAGHEQTLQVDVAEQACLEALECESGGGRFQTAAVSGASVLFTDSHRLTGDASTAGSDLYECAIEVVAAGKLTCSLTDLTPSAGTEAAAVQGSLLGASDDDSTVYFVANGVLASNTVDHGAGPEVAEPGDCHGTQSAAETCNLYLLRDGAISFVSSLSGVDEKNWNAETLSARVSPDGRYLAFMSERSLTGYDNRDAVSEQPDAEVYEFDANTAQLSCASCDPSGARPHGVAYKAVSAAGEGNETLVSGLGLWPPQAWVAALMPGNGHFTSGRGAIYQTRALSPSGRLFFNSPDALAPQDSNSNWDVYEYEPSGVGGCTSSTSGFQAAPSACLGLISSGTSGKQSAFLDASASGADIFFLTSSSLVSTDVDAARDVYDAHECLGARDTACFPESEPPPPACTGDACQQPATPPVDSTPGSLTFNGAGNVLECPKGKVKKSGKCVSKKSSKKNRHKKMGRKRQRRANSDRGSHE